MVRIALAIALIACLSIVRPAQAELIDADASGNWYNPEQAGHGLQIEVLDLSQAVLAWYTFDAQGNPLWLFGIGTITGDTLRAEVTSYAGTAFPPDFDADEIEGAAWGEVIFRRTGCHSASVEWIPVTDAFESGQMPLERLTHIDGLSCRDDGPWAQERRWTPVSTEHGFESLFLDYPAGDEDQFALEAGFEALPAPWSTRGGVKISGNNASDDLMMVLMRPLDGLAPDTRYEVELEMQFATNEPTGCVGVGGSPGESVYMRLGASTEKPDVVLVDGYRRAALDLGQQASPGERALSAGNMANGADESFCSGTDAPWRFKRVSTSGQEFSVTSDESGRIWVYGLSDSGFEATTTWYLTEFVVRYAEVD